MAATVRQDLLAAGSRSVAAMPTLVIAQHTPLPSLQAMLEAVLAGARDEMIEGVDARVRPALAATPIDVLAADRHALHWGGRPVSARWRN